MKRGLTLIELLVSFAIITLILGSVLTIFRNYLNIGKKQDSVMRLNLQLQLLQKQIYLDFLMISPYIKMDNSGNIFVAGEEQKSPISKHIKLVDLDKNKKNGYEGIDIFINEFEPFNNTYTIKYRVNKNLLIRIKNKKEKIICKDLNYLHFFPIKDGVKINGQFKIKNLTQDFSTVCLFENGFVRIAF